MPFANSNGVKIYFEVEGNGPPLVLAHASGGTVDGWRRWGWTDALRGDFRLILFDARGHGRSDKPLDALQYDIGLRVKDVTAILDDLGIEEAHYFGYSLGAIIGWRIALMAPQRFHSFIFGGMSSYRGEVVQKAVQEGRDIELYQMRVDDPEKAFLLQEKGLGRPMTAEEKNAVLANDARAQLAAVLALRPLRSLTDSELANITAPCLLFCGDLDPRKPEVIESARRMPRATFVCLPGLGHNEAFHESAVSLPHVTRFLSEVS